MKFGATNVQQKLRTYHDLGHILVECDLGAMTVE